MSRTGLHFGPTSRCAAARYSINGSPARFAACQLWLRGALRRVGLVGQFRRGRSCPQFGRSVTPVPLLERRKPGGFVKAGKPACRASSRAS
jgi:hypothetical protein